METNLSDITYSEKEVKMGLLRQKTISLDSEVNGRMVEYVQASLQALAGQNNPPLTVCITSHGGDVMAGLDIYDMLSTYPSPITGIVVSYAQSMAAVILQACSKRMSYRHARIMIHHISSRQISLDVLRSGQRLGEVHRDMEKMQGRIYTILSMMTGQTIRRVSAVCKLDKNMTAQEALEFGLIDEIVPIRGDLIKP